MMCMDNDESWTPEALERLAENYAQITRMTLGPLLWRHPAGRVVENDNDHGGRALETKKWWMCPTRWLLFIPVYVGMVFVHPAVTFIACFETVSVQSASLCEIEYGALAPFKVFYPAALMLGFSLRVFFGTVLALLAASFTVPTLAVALVCRRVTWCACYCLCCRCRPTEAVSV